MNKTIIFITTNITKKLFLEKLIKLIIVHLRSSQTRKHFIRMLIIAHAGNCTSPCVNFPYLTSFLSLLTSHKLMIPWYIVDIFRSNRDFHKSYPVDRGELENAYPFPCANCTSFHSKPFFFYILFSYAALVLFSAATKPSATRRCCYEIFVVLSTNHRSFYVATWCRPQRSIKNNEVIHCIYIIASYNHLFKRIFILKS